jgi:FAD/FMN-containing dehydrogenase
MIKPSSLARELAMIVGEEHVLEDPALRAAYETDWTGRFSGPARFVVRPGSPEEVRAVLTTCHRASAPILSQGGNTGLVGGGVPAGGEVLLSLRRLRTIGPIDETAGQVTADAGVTLAALSSAAKQAGWDFGIDFGARDSATVGGMIATNAGGIHVLRHGSMRDQLLGIEAVLADGRAISRIGGLRKDNTGYHFPSLICGSEGTLAVVTRARLRLVRPPRFQVVALVGLDGAEEAAHLASDLERQLGSLSAAEVFFADGMDLVLRFLGRPRPIGIHRAYLLVEFAADWNQADALADILMALGVGDAVLAVDGSDRRGLWALREGMTEAISREGIPHKLDVSLPTRSLGQFLAALSPAISALDRTARAIVFGHIGDGNLHVNVLGFDPDDDRVDDTVLRLVLSHGGCISAEHGIGRAKRRWLAMDRSASELQTMHQIKTALDPAGLLNPGVLLPSRAV